MSKQAQIKPGSQQSVMSAPSGLLQRKCGCGKSAGLSGKCSECESKELTLQRQASNDVEENKEPPVMHEMLRSLSLGYDTNDFSRLRATEKPIEQATEAETLPVAKKSKRVACPGESTSNIDLRVNFKDSHNAVQIQQKGVGDNVATIFSGHLKVEPIEIKVKPLPSSGIKTNTSSSQRLLADWEVGPSQTVYKDFAAATYDMSRDIDDTILNAGGPVIDISKKRRDKPPFSQDPFGLDAIERTPALQTIFISSDQPDDKMMIVNPPVPTRLAKATHNDCSPPDKLKQYMRLFDATLFVLARHIPTGEICPVAHLDWQMNIVVKVSNINAQETSPGNFEIQSVNFQPNPVDGTLVTGRGKGASRAPELKTRGGMVANDVPRGKPGFIITQPCV